MGTLAKRWTTGTKLRRVPLPHAHGSRNLSPSGHPRDRGTFRPPPFLVSLLKSASCWFIEMPVCVLTALAVWDVFLLAGDHHHDINTRRSVTRLKRRVGTVVTGSAIPGLPVTVLW